MMRNAEKVGEVHLYEFWWYEMSPNEGWRRPVHEEKYKVNIRNDDGDWNDLRSPEDAREIAIQCARGTSRYFECIDEVGTVCATIVVEGSAAECEILIDWS